MNEIVNIVMAVLLFGVVALACVWGFRGVIREIELQNTQRRKAIEEEEDQKMARRDELFYWWSRASGGGRF